MNLLFNALIITLLLLPGVILRLSYLSIFYSKKTFRSSFSEELLLSLLPTFFLQFLGFIIIKNKLDVTAFYLLLINSDKTIQHLTTAGIQGFMEYCLCLYVCAALLGYGCRKLVQHYSLDIRIPLLRLYNDWYYHLWGFVTTNKKGQRIFNGIDSVWLDVLVDNKDGSYIYSGWLNEFVLSKEEGVDFFCLNAVRRRKMDLDKPNKPDESKTTPVDVSADTDISYDNYQAQEETTAELNNYIDERYYYMPGQDFIIPYAEVKNINITYFIEEEN